MPTQETDSFLEDIDLDDDEDDSSGDGFLDNVDINDFSLDEESERTKVDYKPEIYFSSSEDMEDVDDESVHLIVTSPPYNAGWEYGSHDDDLDYYREYPEEVNREVDL